MPAKKKSSLGGALRKAASSGSRHSRHYDPNAAAKHTTDFDEETRMNMQSKVEHTNDLEAFLAKAEMAHNDFAAERRGESVIVSVGGQDVQKKEDKESGRLQAQKEHEAAIRVPRRPPWTADMTKEELDYNEKEAFLDWRRELANVEQDGRLVLTPFEKNLEVWRQLWRVIERSDLVVQVVDSRDPLFYLCEDLNEYVGEVGSHKGRLVLLNKADFLPPWLRRQWAEYFKRMNVPCLFWSAKAELERQADEDADSEDEDDAAYTGGDEDIRVLGQAEVLRALEAAAAAAAERAEEREEGRRTTVGFVGYPNVGKSSTLNALVGTKKASVAATPGKTKHFQTINVSDSLCLCDCPGLVFPQFSQSKADMAAAGVLPIERLTDIRTPVGLVAERCDGAYLEGLYALKLPRPAAHEPPDRPPTAQELLRSYAASRNFVASSGLPDETRAGRQILKDYRDGKLCCCRLPPSSTRPKAAWPYQDFYCPLEKVSAAPGSSGAGAAEAGGPSSITLVDEKGRQHHVDKESVLKVGEKEAMEFVDLEDLPVGGLELGEGEDGAAAAGPSYQYGVKGRGGEAAVRGAAFGSRQEEKGKQVRAAHKFHMKMKRTKGTRGQDKAMGGDGGMMAVGKRGGLRPMSMQIE